MGAAQVIPAGRMLAIPREGQTFCAAALANALGLKLYAMRRQLVWLMAAGCVRRTGNGRYRLTAKGVELGRGWEAGA